MSHAFARNPLATRGDLQQAVRDLCLPLEAHASPGGARVSLGETGAHFSHDVAELEGFARPLWGIAPLLAGGSKFEPWHRYRAGLANGSDPGHAEYWGAPRDRDQRIVEMGPIGFALAVMPDTIWGDLDPADRVHLTKWLNTINDVEIVDNNWLWCRVLVNLGLARVNAKHDEAGSQTALRRLEKFYLGDGWYSDGPTAQRDYYIAFMHLYALVYSTLAGESDPARSALFRERAAAFAGDFMHWFAADGSALPYGRSLTYRFAQSAFWGALAYANVKAASWGTIKGLLLRNLRHWSRQPIFTDGDILSIGYGYPNLLMAEQYNSPASPYWALMSFLPIALPDSHPFWQAEEEPLPVGASVSPQKHPGMILCRDEYRTHVFALAGGQYADFRPRHVAEKYSKFAYSTAFGFSVPSAQTTEEGGAHDSTLALTEDDLYFRVRHECLVARIDGGGLYSKWRPFEDVNVETWLVPMAPWHVRIHRLRTERRLSSREGGFAVSCGDGDEQDPGRGPGFRRRSHHAFSVQPAGATGIHDLLKVRQGKVLRPHPNTNLMYPRTEIPVLVGHHAPGAHWLACAVLGLPAGADPAAYWEEAPKLVRTRTDIRVIDRRTKETVFSISTEPE